MADIIIVEKDDEKIHPLKAVINAHPILKKMNEN